MKKICPTFTRTQTICNCVWAESKSKAKQKKKYYTVETGKCIVAYHELNKEEEKFVALWVLLIAISFEVLLVTLATVTPNE